jgi:hypothetical protein
MGGIDREAGNGDFVNTLLELSSTVASQAAVRAGL